MKHRIHEKKTELIINEIGEEYKDLLVDRVLQDSNEVDIDRISVPELIRLDIAIKTRLRSSKRTRNRRKMMFYIASFGLVYVFFGLLFLIYSMFSRDISRTSNLVSIASMLIMLGLITTVLSIFYIRVTDKVKKESSGMIPEYEIIDKWKEIEGLVIQLTPANDSLSLSDMIKQLCDSSVMTTEDVEVINRLLKIRNQVVHLKSTEYTFTQTELKELFAKSDDIVEKMRRIL